MISVIEHIEYLLRKHDCVIVPGWGAFIAQYTHAQIHIDGNNVLPPMRQFGFNGALTFSDGLLESSIIRKEKCSYTEACDIIKSNVLLFKQQVEIEGELAIGRLGLFHKNEENELLFSPFRQYAQANLYYGFQQFSVKSLSEMQNDIIENNIYEEDDAPNIKKFSFNKKYIQIAASIIVLLIMSFVLSTPIPIDKHVYNQAGINDSFRLTESKSAIADIEQDSKELFIALPKDAKVSKSADSVKTSSTKFKEGRYYLVVASGRSLDEANQYIDYQNRDKEDFRILQVDGRFRVYVASGASFKDLMDVRPEFESQYPDSWICKN